jgi:arachidonate 15-lipoxygenase
MSDRSFYAHQDTYYYDPTTLTPEAGPSRIFPHKGTEGMLRYIIDEVGHDVLRQLPAPISELLQEFDKFGRNAEETWLKFTTLLVDLKVFQSDLFNFNLPAGEQFSPEFVRLRKAMGEALLAAKKAAKGDKIALQRQRFYEALEHHDRPRPKIMAIYERDQGLSDREFCRQRLAGPNPIQIYRVQERSTLEGLDQTVTSARGETTTLAEAAEQNRLFTIDYPLLDLAPEQLQEGRYVGSPKAFFYRTEHGLEPVLIQVEPRGKVYTPTSDADDWMRAKLYVQVADVTQHELITHLCFTHLAMEAFAIATPRRLPSEHPLYRLLRPHFRFLLAINTRGNEILLGEGAAIDTLMAPTRPVSLSLINRAYRTTPFSHHALPTDVQRRGVDPEFLPEYAYRDDAQLVWQAIYRYVAAYIQQYYPSDAEIQHDTYLQAWAAELGLPLKQRSRQEFAQAPDWVPEAIVAEAGLVVDLPDYPRVPDFPNALHPGRFTTVQQLVDALTQIIFTCSAQHAAVNFSQFDYFGFAPNAPLAAYAPPDSSACLCEVLPSAEKDLGQIELTFALSGIRWSQLGSSYVIEFTKESDRQVLRKFQAELDQIGMTIDLRNAQRKLSTGIDYPYLHPLLIPNSINI